MSRSRLAKTALIATACATAGAAAGIAGSSAAGGSRSAPRHPPRAGFMRHGLLGGGPGRERAVHADAVVLNQAGNAFETVTTDSGTFKSLSGDQLTITESAGSVTYKDVTLTIPSGATVMRNFASASLSALASGDRVRVLSSPERTVVMAVDAAHQQLDRGPHGGGPPPWGGPRGAGGPPPGAPDGPGF